MERTYWYFKLFNSIKETHEVDFAELELSSLFGGVERVRNFADILFETPFHRFTENVRVQDYLAHELPYGECEGFYGEKNGWADVEVLVRRLAYTREFFAVTEGDDPEELLKKTFPAGKIDKNVQFFQEDGKILFRFITNQYFLEKSQYISKLSRNEQEANNNIEILFNFLTRNLKRIPASSTMQVGKRLEDYFTIREEPSLHLTHYMHPYKGKFHPKMVRALLNYAHPEDKGTVMDNFAGCGTMLVEATWMGLDSKGVEINPLSVLMSNVKCNSLSLDPKVLKNEMMVFLQTLETAQLSYEKQVSGTMLLAAPRYDVELVERRRKEIPERVVALFKNSGVIEKILIAHQLIDQIKNRDVGDFLLLGLSGTISDLLRRRSGEFLDVLKDRLMDLYLRIYIFHRLNEVLQIKLGDSETFVGDTRDMVNSCRRLDGTQIKIADGVVKAIVNSPPYSTALDYIRNDYSQLTILNLTDITHLEYNMMGNPNFRIYPDSLLLEIKNKEKDYTMLPKDAKETISMLLQAGRKKEALRTYRFFKDMFLTLKEMHRVLDSGCKAIIIIGNNHYKIDGEYIEVKNDEVIMQMGLTIGFTQDRRIVRELEKSRTGMIRYESIMILQKQTQPRRN